LKAQEITSIDRSDRLRIVLFALTGFGNTVLEALLKDERISVGAVFTVHYENRFPYYEERHLDELCEERQIDCYTGVKVGSAEGIQLLYKHSPDLILMATFKQVLKENILGLPPLGVVNFHPSLLPSYRGPCPTNAVLINDEKSTGISIHYVTEEIDEGNILLQRSIAISETDNDGRLRQKLATLAGEITPELVGMFAGFTKPAGSSQDHSLATYAPKPTVEDGYLERASDIRTIQKMMRAFNPLPGTSLLVGDTRVTVDRYELSQDNKPHGIYESAKAIDLSFGSQVIRLYKKLSQ